MVVMTGVRERALVVMTGGAREHLKKFVKTFYISKSNLDSVSETFSVVMKGPFYTFTTDKKEFGEGGDWSTWDV